MFGLLEAMSAIEMMDPKMDAGMCCNREATPLTFDTAVEVHLFDFAQVDSNINLCLRFLDRCDEAGQH